MIPFFSNPLIIAHLVSVAESWRGTPFHPHGLVKGPRGGCSCQTLVGSIYNECGVFGDDWLQIPKGSLRHHRAHGGSLIAAFVDALPQLVTVEDRQIQPGDMMLFVDDHCEHSAIALPDNGMVHCMMQGGVQFSRWDDPTFSQQLSKVWRPI